MGSPDQRNKELEDRSQLESPTSNEDPIVQHPAVEAAIDDNATAGDDENAQPFPFPPIDLTREYPGYEDMIDAFNYVAINDQDNGLDDDDSDKDSDGWTRADNYYDEDKDNDNDGDEPWETSVPDEEEEEGAVGYSRTEPPPTVYPAEAYGIPYGGYGDSEPYRTPSPINHTQADQIKTAMSSVSLKLTGVQPPEWATQVPESVWIAELLKKVREAQAQPPASAPATK